MSTRIIYADNAATTPVSDTVLNAMIPYFKEHFGNASGIYSIGRQARKAVETSRDKVAAALGCKSKEIFFTSSGTEADNWAITGVAKYMLSRGKNHIITSEIEHHAVLNTCHALEKEGFQVTYIPVEQNGIIDPINIENAITEQTFLVSLMSANNEIGTVQPIYETGLICKKHNILFHTDAVQAVAHMSIDVNKLNIDLLSLSGHKIHAPKGIGALYVRSGTGIYNLVYGGDQEHGKRPGTENVPGIVGLGIAVEESLKDIEMNKDIILNMRNCLIDGLLKIPGSHLNGDRTHRLPGNCNISIDGVDSEGLVLFLDLKGICVSGGSACTSGSSEPSHVITALGKSREEALSAVRFTIDEHNTPEEIDYILEVVPDIVNKIRKTNYK